jgi:Domain of unknown function (DUF4129)
VSVVLAQGVPVDLDRAAAARAAREELAKQIYREDGPSLTEQLLRWVFHYINAVLDRAAGVSPGGYVGLVGVVIVVLAIVVALRLGVGPMRRSSTTETALFVGSARTAAEHRAAADAHAAEGRWAEAVRDRLRAIITGLEERTLLEPRPGRTADEAAADAGVVVPECAADLRAAARVFDDIWYGARPADSTHDALLRELDGRVRSSRPTIRTPA